VPSRRRFLGAAAGWAGAAVAGALAADRPAGGATRTDTAPPSGAVRARVLGIAQDGGVPHLGCERSCCVAARRDRSRARRVACLGLFGQDPATTILVDATPDMRAQIADLRDASGLPALPGLPVDRILLTHAHIGHYTGLMFLGRESVAAKALPVTATPRMEAFLRANKPWSRLAEWGHIRIEAVDPGATLRPMPGLAVTLLPVPHRDEDSDTVAFLFEGAKGRLLYVPDTDAWEKWPRPLASYLASADVALLDGTFFDPSELPGRDLSEIPHPLIRRTIDALGGAAPAGCRVLFTHLNHTNPALDPASAEAALIAKAGFGIAAEGMEFPL